MITLLVVIIIAGVVLYLVNTMLPMDPRFKTVLNVVACILLLLYVLSAVGLIGPIRLR